MHIQTDPRRINARSVFYTFGPPATIVTGAGSVRKTITGYSLGGGVEFAYLPGVKIRVQYMHIGLPSVSYTLPLNVASCLPAPNGCTAGNELVSLTPRFNQVTIGVGFGL